MSLETIFWTVCKICEIYCAVEIVSFIGDVLFERIYNIRHKGVWHGSHFLNRTNRKGEN